MRVRNDSIIEGLTVSLVSVCGELSYFSDVSLAELKECRRSGSFRFLLPCSWQLPSPSSVALFSWSRLSNEELTESESETKMDREMKKL